MKKMPGWYINKSNVIFQPMNLPVLVHVIYHTLQALLIVDVILLVSGVLSAIPLSADDSKIPGYPWLLICRFGVGFGAGGTAQS